jgi:hypothetical protein
MLVKVIFHHKRNKKAAVRNSDFISLGVATPIVFDQHIIIGG